jgi:hypothetical protein
LEDKNAKDIYFRSTNQFTVDLSTDKTTWTNVITGALQDGRAASACNQVPVEDFLINPPHEARYIKFTILSIFGASAGINFISWAEGQVLLYTLLS